MQERKLGCDIGTNPVKPKTELEETAEKLGVTPAKLDAMRKYAILLRRSDSRIKQSTITKKLKEKFKIKLV